MTPLFVTEPHVITDNLDELLAILPSELSSAIRPQDRPQLVEIVLDLGRKPEARFMDRYEYLRDEPVSRLELDGIESKLGNFGDDNRAGLPATLHRISAMRNRRGGIDDGGGSTSGKRPGVIEPSTDASRAPVALAMVPGSPCAVR